MDHSLTLCTLKGKDPKLRGFKKFRSCNGQTHQEIYGKRYRSQYDIQSGCRQRRKDDDSRNLRLHVCEGWGSDNEVTIVKVQYEGETRE